MNFCKKISSVFFVFALIFISAFSQEKKDALKLYSAGNFTEAISTCEKEIHKHNKNIDSYVVLCWALVANRQYAEAEVWATKAKELSPYDQRVVEILAESKYYQGKNEEALTLFQDYIGLVKSNGARMGDAYYFMGEIYIRTGRFQHADIAFSQAVKTEPLKDVWWARLGYAREMTKNYKLSLVAYEQALKINGQNNDAKKGRQRVAEHI